MRQLTIVRHGHAEKQHGDIEDFERRLDKRGRKEAEAMAELAHRCAVRPDHVVSSPAVRAIATAKEFARALAFPLPRIRHDDRLYLAERSQIVAILRSVPASARHVLLVGHNPGLSRLAAWLTDRDDIGELPTAALVTLRADIESWDGLGQGTCDVVRVRWPDDGREDR